MLCKITCFLQRWPGLRRNFLSICYCWMSFSMGYFGIMYNMPTTQNNVYIAFMIPAILYFLTFPLYPYLQVNKSIFVKAVFPHILYTYLIYILPSICL